MEIRCTNCQHIGPAREVRPTNHGVELICANCAHANPLEVGAAPDAPAQQVKANLGAEIDVQVARARASQERARATQASASAQNISPFKDLITPKTLERLVPEPGPGPRCPKCAHLLGEQDLHCERCGLNVMEARRHAPGRAPWELAPRGKEAPFEQANLLWSAATEQWGRERVDNFAAFIISHGLYEHALRLLRFYLVEHPRDALAMEHLQVMATKLQTRAIAARSQAQVSAQEFEQKVTGTRHALIGATLLFWGGIFLLFLFMFMDNC